MLQEQRDNQRWLVAEHADEAPLVGVTFRVGLLDDAPEALGLHNVAIWLLRLATDAPAEFDFEPTHSAFASGSLRTVFLFVGTESDVSRRMDDLIAKIESPPVELFADALERARIEAPFVSTATAHLFAHRWGPTGPGLAALKPLGLDNVTPEDVGAHIRKYFCSSNSVMWTTSQVVAASVRNRLSIGAPSAPQAVAETTNGRSTFVSPNGNTVYLTALVDSKSTGRMVAEIIASRVNTRVSELQALAAHVALVCTPVDADHVLMAVEAVAGEGKQIAVADAMSQTMDDFGATGPAPEELIRERLALQNSLRETSFAELLDSTAAEILLTNSSDLIQEYEGSDSAITDEISRNVALAYSSAQLVVDEAFKDHAFDYPTFRNSEPPPQSRSKKYRDLLDLQCWYRLDGPVLSYVRRKNRYRPGAVATEWAVDLRHVRTLIEWSNGSATMLGDYGDATLLVWDRIAHADTLRERVERRLRVDQRITARSEESLEPVRKAVKKITRVRRGSFALRALLVLILAGSFLSAAFGGPSKAEQRAVIDSAAAPKPVNTNVALGTKVRLPNGTTVEIYSFNPQVPSNTAGFQEASADIQVCGGLSTPAAGASSSLAGQFANTMRNLIAYNDFELVMTDNTVALTAQDKNLLPALPEISLADGDCRRGTLGFTYLPGKTAQKLAYQNAAQDTINWPLPGE